MSTKKITTKYPILHYWKSFLWAIIIAIGLLTPGDKLPKQNLLHFAHADKVLHFLIFFGLEWLALYENIYQGFTPPRLRYKIAVTAIVSLYAGSTEIMQLYFTTKRDPDFFDFLADFAGILFALLSFEYSLKLINRFFRRQK